MNSLPAFCVLLWTCLDHVHVTARGGQRLLDHPLDMDVIKSKSELYMDTLELVVRHGYPVETHVVTSLDGYMSTLHRIPHGRGDDVSRVRPPVIRHFLLQRELVVRHGYPVETHVVTSHDGYMSTLHRIPHGRGDDVSRVRPPVIRHFLLQRELVVRHGYPVETHVVTSLDGYMSTLHRIPHGRGDDVSRVRPPVIRHLLLQRELVVRRGYPVETHVVTSHDGYMSTLHRIPHGRGDDVSRVRPPVIRHFLLQRELVVRRGYPVETHVVTSHDGYMSTLHRIPHGRGDDVSRVRPPVIRHFLLQRELVVRHGYPVETHVVTSHDGYMSTLHRIPHGRGDDVSRVRPPVIRHFLLQRELVVRRGYPVETHVVTSLDGYMSTLHRIPHGRGDDVSRVRPPVIRHFLLQRELVVRHGYPVETHVVTSLDGYMSTLHRIPHGRGDDVSRVRPPVIRHFLLQRELVVRRGYPVETHVVTSHDGYMSTLHRIPHGRGDDVSRVRPPVIRHFLLQLELVVRHGYPVETHVVTSHDGYMSTLHRIPHGRGDDVSRVRPPVIRHFLLQRELVVRRGYPVETHVVTSHDGYMSTLHRIPHGRGDDVSRVRPPVIRHFLLQLELVVRRGYPVETHVVTSHDGYMSTLHRIPHGRGDDVSRVRPPVIRHFLLQLELVVRRGYPVETHVVTSHDGYMSTLHRIPHGRGDDVSRVRPPVIRHFLLQLELVVRRGYPVETHVVTSHDGYMSTLHRIPHGRGDDVSRVRPPVIRHFLLQLELVVRRGYPVETHVVTSLDGYMSTLHRIPHGRGDDVSRVRPPVLLMHAMALASDCWVLSEVNSSPGFILADSGYDVWMGNARGNFYSRRHLTLSPKDPKFWEFSWHEMGSHDLPAMIDYILQTTQQQQLFYIGHSMGATMFFVLMSTQPQYNEKIKLMVALAPGVYHGNVRSLGMRILIHNAKLFVTLIPTLLAHGGGASVDSLNHYLVNMKSKQFQWYDMKRKDRGKKLYDLSKVTCPVSLHYAANDKLVHPEGIRRLHKELPNVVGLTRIMDDRASHVDFILALHIKELIYDDVMSIMNKHGH